MADEKRVGIQDLEVLLDEGGSIITIHADGTVTQEELAGPPTPPLTFRSYVGSTY